MFAFSQFRTICGLANRHLEVVTPGFLGYDAVKVKRMGLRNKRKPKDVTATETEKRFTMIVPVRAWVLLHCLTSVDIKNALKKLVI